MTIYRGPGGTGSATSDSDNTEFQAFLVQSQAARDAAQAAQTAAETAKTNAENAETNAETAETNAETAATNAASSASSAASSASSASSSASAASTSASNASSSASSASTSASAASSSASAASTSASNAATSATNAASSATASASSATAASGSATSAASSASTATTQASNASSSASAAATSATNASNSATASASSATASANSASSSAASAAAAALALDNFDDRYLGVKTAAPTLDNDGNALVAGALYFNSGAVTPADKGMWVYDGGTWIAASAASQAIMVTYEYVATQGQTTFTGADVNALVLSYTVGSLVVTLNGVKLRPGNDYTASTGNSVVLLSGAAAGDDLVVDAFATFDIANTYTQAEVDAALTLKAPTANPTFTGLVTTAGQIKFPSTQNASSDANTLDDYEEGTFTPTFPQNAGSPTFTLQDGRYVKIGKVVHVWGRIEISAKASVIIEAGIGGLPFPSASGFFASGGSLGRAYSPGGIAPSTMNGAFFSVEGTNAYIRQPSGSFGTFGLNDFGNSGSLWFGITYQTES